jgi:hypothetical protein
MIRRMYCFKCGGEAMARPFDAEDYADGWRFRYREITAYKPAVHSAGINGKEIKLPGLICDFCGDDISDGTKAVAFTMWQGTEPEVWETEYENPTRL